MKQPLNNQLLKKYIIRKRITLIADIILITILLLIGSYAYKNIEFIKMFDADPCRVCENKTGGQCIKINEQPITNPIKQSLTFNKTLAENSIIIRQ